MKIIQPVLSSGFKWSLGIICLLCIAAFHIAHRAWDVQIVPGELQVSKSMPEAVSVERLDRPGLWRIHGASGDVGYAFLTTSVEPVVRGYRGEIAILVGVDGKGTITCAELVDHQETPYYMNMLLEDRFLEGLPDLDLKGPDSLKGEMDAVSGATVTSRAIVRDVFMSGHTVLREQLGIENIEADSGIDAWKAGLALAAVGLAILSVAFGGRISGLRWLAWIGNLLLVGFILQAPLSLVNLADLAAGRPPGALNIEVAIILYAALIGGLVFGRFHCRAVCPFGAMQEIAARSIGGRYRSAEPTGALGIFLSQMPFVVLCVLVVLIFGGGLWPVAAFEPYSMLFSGKLSAPVLLYAAAALIPCIFFPRFWCRFLCPTGAALDLVSRLTRRRSWWSGENRQEDSGEE